MTTQQKIQIIKNLLEAANELNGEFQDGWDEIIEQGEQLLQFLKNQSQQNFCSHAMALV